MKTFLRHSAGYLLASACALALAACGAGSSGSGQADAQSKQMQRSTKAVASDYASSVQELYVAYFGRPADPSGLANFENELAAADAPPDLIGLSAAYTTNPRVAALINSFETSAESQALYGGGNTQAFVSSIFQNILGRQPAPSGLAFWTNAIDSGSLTQGDAALSIMAGAMKNNTQQGVLDAQLINNRLAVADYFTGQVSSQNMVSAYSGHTAAGVARSMLSSVTATTDVASFNTANVSAALTTLLAPVNVTLDKTSLQFAAFIGYGVSPQSINVNIAGGTRYYYGQVVSDQPSVVQATFSETSNAAGIVTVTPVGNAPVVTSGSITVQLCADSACNQVVWSQPVPYSLAMFSIVNPYSGVTISGYEGAMSGAVSLGVSPADTLGRITVTASTSTGGSWLTAGHGSDGTINVSASGAGLSAGSYQGSVTLSVPSAYGSTTISVPVSFAVGDGIIAPAAGTLNLNGTTALSALTGSARVGFNGSQSPSWTASSDQSWLVLNTAAGTGAGNIQYSVNSANVSAVPNWGSATANITISAPGLTSVTVPVTLNKRLPEIYSVSPGVVVAGRANTVQVVGRGLSQLSGVGQIVVAGASGVTGTITSDTGAVLNLPSLAAGRATVSVQNAASIATRSSTIGATQLSAYSYAFTPASGEVTSTIFDPVRNALYVVSTANNTLMRYSYNDGQWQVGGMPVAGIGDMAFAPDHNTLYVVSAGANLLAVDPDAMQVKATYPYAPAYPLSVLSTIAPGYEVPTGLAVTADMRIWFNGDQWTTPTYFDMLNNVFGTTNANQSLYSATFFASGDGSRMVAIQRGISPAQPNEIYLASTSSFTTPAGVPQPYQDVRYSQDGSIMLVDRQSLYNGINYSLIGTTPNPTGIVLGGALSPDGTRVYQLVTANSNSLVADHVDIYDATQIQSATSSLTKLGQIAVSDQAASCGNQYVYGCNSIGTFVISPLGDTLFWAGNQGMVVLPIPSEMSGVKSAVRKLRKAGTR